MAERDHSTRLGAAWDLLRTGAWIEARSEFERILREQPSGSAYEGLAWSAWWLNDIAATVAAREQAYQSYRAAGDRVGAGRAAMWLGSDYSDFYGDPAVVRGWLRRARRMLDGIDPVAEHGWLAGLEAWSALLEDHDAILARQLGATTARLGRELGSPDLEAIGMATEGLALVTQGKVAEGMPLLDEAATIALSGEFEQLWAVAWPCCFVIYACEQVHDHSRAAQWCRKVEQFSATHRLGYAWSLCRAHHAAVLVLEGDWAGAEVELRDAAQSLADIRPPWVVEATVRMAELRRRQGRFAEAVALFRQAEGHPLAYLGLAELHLDRGEPEAAVEQGERLLRTLPITSRTHRTGALQILVRANAAAGDHDAAAAWLAELDTIATLVATVPLKTMASSCAGVLAAARGELQVARRRFEDTLDLARRAQLPYESAQARIELAAVLARLGRALEASEQARRAEAELRRLGAVRAADRAAGLVEPQRRVLTAREREVLALVALGHSDREVAAALTLSEHTVHRHMSNVLTKLDCGSRASAVARAAELGLLDQIKR